MISNLIQTQVDRWIQAEDLKEDLSLFEKIVSFNIKEDRLNSTTRLLRSLSIKYRTDG